jgi:hypothetical protein
MASLASPNFPYKDSLRSHSLFRFCLSADHRLLSKKLLDFLKLCDSVCFSVILGIRDGDVAYRYAALFGRDQEDPPHGEFVLGSDDIPSAGRVLGEKKGVRTLFSVFPSVGE